MKEIDASLKECYDITRNDLSKMTEACAALQAENAELKAGWEADHKIGIRNLELREQTEQRNSKLQAENAEQREALQSIKARVCGEMTNGWKDQWDTTNSRGAIADICDKALAKAEGK
jgi:hypothetical protein